jgi:hypothetical protein
MLNTIIFIIISLFSFYLTYTSYDKIKIKNLTYKIVIIDLLHSFTSIYLYLGSLLFGYYKFHSLVIFTMFIIWFVFDNRCPVTLYINKQTKQEKKTPFKDIIYHLGLNHYLLLYIVLVYNFYKLNYFKALLK